MTSERGLTTAIALLVGGEANLGAYCHGENQSSEEYKKVANLQKGRIKKIWKVLHQLKVRS